MLLRLSIPECDHSLLLPVAAVAVVARETVPLESGTPSSQRRNSRDGIDWSLDRRTCVPFSRQVQTWRGRWVLR